MALDMMSSPADRARRAVKQSMSPWAAFAFFVLFTIVSGGVVFAVHRAELAVDDAAETKIESKTEIAVLKSQRSTDNSTSDQRYADLRAAVNRLEDKLDDILREMRKHP